MQDIQHNTSLTQEQTQRLIATSTGFVDVFVIPVYGDVPILLPQTIVLSALNVKPFAHQVEWHERLLPAYTLHSPSIEQATALVIEGENEAQRFALLADDMPESLRLRISSVIDTEANDVPAVETSGQRYPNDTIKLDPATRVYQYVNVEGQYYQIPNLQNIQNALFG